MKQTIIPPERDGGTRLIWRKHPFASRAITHAAIEGLTISQYVEVFRDDLPLDFDRFGVVTINDSPVPRDAWNRVRPRVRQDFEIVVSFHAMPRGGISTSSIIGLAVILAATLVTAGFAAPLLGAAFAAGTIGAKLAGLAIAVVGTLAVNALTPPPSIPALSGPPGTPGVGGTSASLQGNILQPGAPVPRVCGWHRVFPPLACQPLIYIEDGNEVAEAVYILAGVHELTLPQLGEVLISQLEENTEYEQREGDETSATLTLVNRFGRTETVSQALVKTEVDNADNRTLVDQSVPLNSVAKHLTMRSKPSFDEFWITVDFPIGMAQPQSPNAYTAIPLRIRFRRDGDQTWRHLPEFHVQGLKNDPQKKLIRIIRGTSPGIVSPQTNDGPFRAFNRVPMRMEILIGDVTSDALRDGGQTAVASKASSADAYCGASWTGTGGGGARMVNRIWLWPRTGGTGFTNVTNNLTFDVYWKDGTAPANSTNGTIAQTVAITDAMTRVAPVQFSFADMTHDHVWVRMRPTGGGNSTWNLTELEIFGAWEHSIFADDHFRVAPLGVFDGTLTSANFGSSDVQNINLNFDEIDIYLDADTYPADSYDFEIRRGYTYSSTSLDVVPPGVYVLGGLPAGVLTGIVVDLFGFVFNVGTAEYQVPHDYDLVSGEVAAIRYASVKNSAPVTASAYAKMAIKTRQPADRFSVLAAGKVERWNGTTAFDDFGPSDNPADHLFDIWTGVSNKRPLPVQMRDAQSFEDFWDQCDSMGYTINGVFEGRTVKQMARIAAACGYSIERESELFGVIIGRDRSAESTIQQFGYRNARGVRVEKRFNDPLPSAFRIPFRNAAKNYDEDEVFVFRPDAVDDGIYETVIYEGLTAESDIISRANFDWRQALYQSVTYHLEAPIQWIRATKGDTCALAFDIITQDGGSAYVDSVTTSGGNITGFVLDGTIQTTGSTAMGILIRCHDGTTLAKQVNSAGQTRTITFATPFANPGTSVIDQGCLILSGPISQTHKRVIATVVEPKNGTDARMTFVDDISSILFGAGGGLTPFAEHITPHSEAAIPNSPTHTFPTAPIGAEVADALMVIAVGCANATSINTVTVNGNAATAVPNGQGQCKFFQIARPASGTTASIAVNITGGTPLRLTVDIFILQNLASQTVHHSNSATGAGGTSIAATVNVQQQGIAIAFANFVVTGTFTWTNATEALDDANGSSRYSSASFVNPDPAITGHSITATASTSATQRRIAVASWR